MTPSSDHKVGMIWYQWMFMDLYIYVIYASTHQRRRKTSCGNRLVAESENFEDMYCVKITKGAFQAHFYSYYQTEITCDTCK